MSILSRKLLSLPACVFFFILLPFYCQAFQISSPAPKTQCRPPVDIKFSQFIIGYGSLMQEESKREENSLVGVNYPVIVKGFERGWMEPGTRIGFGTTYLGAKKNPEFQINAVFFQLDRPEAITKYDEREDTYCRVKVSLDDIKSLSNTPLPQGEYWIYIADNPVDHVPTKELPLVQSYVDIFLSGCFEVEEKYHLNNFAENCINTTTHWSNYWVNDRVHPRTAFDNYPYVSKIDPLIAKKLPEYFKQIRIE